MMDRQREPSVPSPRAVILGAGRSIRGSGPSAMVVTDENHRVLDWLLDAFSWLHDPEVYFIGGYRINEVTDNYPTIRFLFNSDWAATGPVRSLALMPRDCQAVTYVCYSDIVFRPALVRQLETVESDVVLAVDSGWRVRYERRTQAEMDDAEKVLQSGARVVEIGRQVVTTEANAEFVGLLKFSPAAVDHLHEVLDRFDTVAGIPAIIQHLIDEGFTCSGADVAGDWAHLNAPQDLARFVLGTKAESLERLRPLVRHGQIGAQVSFRYSAWRDSPDEIIARVQQSFGDAWLIVRSSALSEDNWLQSSAGAHRSILNVRGHDQAHIRAAVDEVFGSYADSRHENQVFVQEMLRGITMSGVVMTRTPTLGSPYYVINFDTTGSTDSVTSGEGRESRTVFLLRGMPLRPDLPDGLRRLLDSVCELESLVGHDSLDIEFAIASDGPPHILQVRPIAVNQRGHPVDDEKLMQAIGHATVFFEELNRPASIVRGATTQLSVMADWNPAEMIGTKPQPLAFSLYRHLISDEAWAQQRAEYGYRDVRPCSLIVDVMGHPYIDVRVDFNSFVPASLSDELAEHLVNHYLERLSEHPELHDKVEFDVLITCVSLDFVEQAERLRAAGFRPSEIEDLRESLVKITLLGIARCADDAKAIGELERRLRSIIHGPAAPLERAYLLLEVIRRVAIPLFSHLARNAFVAMILLKSLRNAKVLRDEQVERFLESLRTVAAVMQDHARAVIDDHLSWEEFVRIYGHLRPGSYNIMSPCYADAPEEFLRPVIDQVQCAPPPEVPRAPWDERTWQVVVSALSGVGLEVSAEALERFLRQAIEGREFAKFEFMRGVNAALEGIAEFGQRHGLSREDLAHIRLHELMTLRGARAEDPRDLLTSMARRGREESFISESVCLPGQIFSIADFTCFEQKNAEPNFITRKSVRAPVRALSGQSIPAELSGAIVLVPNADPGYDWLFSRNIGGLVTMYGGVNSHMAIRAAEFGLPAAIGIGELLYDGISRAEVLLLDCATRQIRVVR